MKKILSILLAALLLFSVTGCKEELPVDQTSSEIERIVSISDEDKQNIEQLIYSFYQAAEEQDIEKYMSHLDKNHEIYNYTRLMMTDILEQFKFSYVITDFKIIEADDSHAIVQFKQETRLLEGNDEGFEETRAQIVMKLNHYDDGWKVYDTSLEYSNPIN